MNLISLSFYLFYIVLAVVYYLVPKRFRYMLIFVGSYIFYGWANINILPILIATTSITYVGGLLINRNKAKWLYYVFFASNIIVLVIFKYTNFIIDNINKIAASISEGWTQIPESSILLPIGLSFYIFQSCTYLGDVYKGNIKAEVNPIRYAAFVSFFPTILSGPIQKARDILPQIKNPADFDGKRATQGFILLIWGTFEKLAVANRLAFIVNTVFNSYQNYTYNAAAYYIVAAVSFSMYIYADFSSYSDMARGLSKILGIEIKKNFDNPYLSTSLSEFWTRWHVSLNDWFVEYIYIPLGGNRKGKTRKYINMMIIFIISGLWHGASWNFVVWGGVNGVLVVIGLILRPLKKKLYYCLNIDEKSVTIIWLKRIIVFWFITCTWVFFKNDITASWTILRHITFFSPMRVFVPELLTVSGTYVETFVTIVMIVVFCIIQYRRKEEGRNYQLFRKQPVFIQCIILALVVYVCIFMAVASSTELNTAFLYFQF